jgi:hypothetical protein
MEDLKNQIINKAGFLLYTDYWNKYFSKMTGEQVKEAFNIIFHFNTTFEVLKTNDLAVEMVIATIIDNIKRDASKRAKQSIASAENGKLGGRPKKKKKPNPIPENPKETQLVLKETKPKSKLFIKPTIDEIKNYCLERKNNVNAESFSNYYEARGWKLKGIQMKDWKACVRTWEQNNNNFTNNNFKKPVGMPQPQYDDPDYYKNDGGWND